MFLSKNFSRVESIIHLAIKSMDFSTFNPLSISKLAKSTAGLINNVISNDYEKNEEKELSEDEEEEDEPQSDEDAMEDDEEEEEYCDMDLQEEDDVKLTSQSDSDTSQSILVRRKK